MTVRRLCTRASQFVLAAALASAPAAPGHAQERWLVDAELDLGMHLTQPQRDLFSVGGTLSVGVLRTLAPWVALGARLRTGLFLEGEAVTTPGVADPGLGTLNFAEGALRFRIPDGTERRATGGWLEANAGGGFTGDKLRSEFGGAVGWGFRVGDGYALGPHLRYLQVIDPKGGLDSRDARMLLLGVSFTALDAKDRKEEEPAPPPAAPDRDQDGIPDADDTCPDMPEDLDGFEDDDGCPDEDNDQDAILDEDDGCPNMAEDLDGFEDDDGCPDDDNDGDEIADEIDQCPLEAETVNGVQDEDGCPDAGLIEMHEMRIVLKEHVLFDTDKARIRSRGRPTLQAVVDLVAQHPEWLKMHIEGHADARGDADFNQKLSERRAASTRRALVSMGIDPSRLTAEGYGARRPMVEGNTDEAYQQNRRVEFVVTEISGRHRPGEASSETEERLEQEVEAADAAVEVEDPDPADTPVGDPTPDADGGDAQTGEESP